MVTSVAIRAADLPKFVQIASARLRNDDVGEAAFLLPDGYKESVFSVPMVVDPDGVIEPKGFFTRSDGGQRPRKACFVGAGAQVTLVIEGSRPNTPPSLRTVVGPDTKLIPDLVAGDGVATEPSPWW